MTKLNMTSEQTLLLRAVREKVSCILEDSECCHDLDHTLRVLSNASILAEAEKVSAQETFALFLAALLHDCARPEEFASGGKVCHAQLGGAKSEKILQEVSCSDEELIQTVKNAVTRHRFRGKDKPETLVDRLLYDADKLDSIGAVGIGRAFLFAGRLGARLHNSEAEALSSEAYSREDSAYREYLVKLRHVPERMLTSSGKHLALERKEFMEQYFCRLQQEAGDGKGFFPEI